jgi:hypothetical protein
MINIRTKSDPDRKRGEVKLDSNLQNLKETGTYSDIMSSITKKELLTLTPSLLNEKAISYRIIT